MYSLSISAMFLIISTTTAHPLSDGSINISRQQFHRIPNEFLRHGAYLPNSIRQSFPTVTACTSQSDCTPKQECTLDPTTGCKSGFCIVCTTAADCSNGQVCFQQQFSNICVDEDTVCSSRADCDDDQLCFIIQNSNSLGSCVEKGIYCESDDDCTKPKSFTLGIFPSEDDLGICQLTCNRNSDCEDGQTCSASICITPACMSDSDCENGGSFSFGTCFATNTPVTSPSVTGPTCSSDDNCQVGFVCDSTDEQGDRYCVRLLTCDSLKTPTPAATLTVELATPAPTNSASSAAKPSPMAVFPMKPSAESTPKSSPEPSAESLQDSSVQSSTESGPEPSAQGDVDSPSRVCVDVRALSAFQSHQLLFEKHGMAWVLCDANESCATAGHMVVFRGQVMMMNTYCDIVGCEKRSMHVNSPRYTRGLRVQSRTGGLAYTFAARHEIRMEEGVFRVAIRLGL